ncbi:MAG: hypothetical protein US96_C0035G0003 [Candidatus Woesebacteria bacterium GW2011_GWB1_38_5b]|uniref:Uncharacterized protein n=1 Tax=Candidatus Woesebacteria bacterium GW2011_GWB1_38_5b TaxID=1618569 RepID=A0A0G0MKQ5_9BACT|nr:MAG: hypothetical protein US96_C0035G0003 [Candidatus Woesebacteria bacterium GW2011_GWB1_38_5b]
MGFATLGWDLFPTIEDTRKSRVVETSIMDWAEFMTRNLYPSEAKPNSQNPEVYQRIMARNAEEVSKRRVNNVVLLTLLSGGEETELFGQTFAPELGFTGDTHWSKKRIPDEIFQEGLDKYRDFISNPSGFPELQGLSNTDKVLRFLEVTSSFVPENVKTQITQRIGSMPEADQAKVVEALTFSLALHCEEMDRELALLNKHSQNSNSYIANVAKFAKDYLEAKPRLDKSSSETA